MEAAIPKGEKRRSPDCPAPSKGLPDMASTLGEEWQGGSVVPLCHYLILLWDKKDGFGVGWGGREAGLLQARLGEGPSTIQTAL